MDVSTKVGPRRRPASSAGHIATLGAGGPRPASRSRKRSPARVRARMVDRGILVRRAERGDRAQDRNRISSTCRCAGSAFSQGALLLATAGRSAISAFGGSFTRLGTIQADRRRPSLAGRGRMCWIGAPALAEDEGGFGWRPGPTLEPTLMRSDQKVGGKFMPGKSANEKKGVADGGTNSASALATKIWIQSRKNITARSLGCCARQICTRWPTKSAAATILQPRVA